MSEFETWFNGLSAEDRAHFGTARAKLNNAMRGLLSVDVECIGLSPHELRVWKSRPPVKRLPGGAIDVPSSKLEDNLPTPRYPRACIGPGIYTGGFGVYNEPDGRLLGEFDNAGDAAFFVTCARGELAKDCAKTGETFGKITTTLEAAQIAVGGI